MPASLETQIQIALIQWISVVHPSIRPCVIHVANQRATSPQSGALLKKMGVKRGVSDIFIAHPSISGKHGLFLELKTKGGVLSKEQKGFIELMMGKGFEAKVAYGLDEAINIINAYLKT